MTPEMETESAPISSKPKEPNPEPRRELTVLFNGGNAEEMAAIRVAQRGTTRFSQLLRSGEDFTHSIDWGSAVVEARLPNGEVLAQDVDPDEEKPLVRFVREGAAHEWLGWDQYLFGDMPRARDGRRLLDRTGPITVYGERIFESVNEQPDAVEMVLGRGSHDDVEVVRVEVRDEVHLLSAPCDWGDGASQVKLLLTATDDDALRASISVRETVLAVLGFVASGDLPSARQASNQVMLAALNTLFFKARNPHLAAAAAYVLLRTLRNGRTIPAPLTWFDNLARRFPKLPDGAIAAGWRMLLTRGGDRHAARALFEEAIRRGLPLYTQGLSLLIDGLALVAPRSSELESVRALRPFIDPTPIFTTLHLTRDEHAALPAGRVADALAKPPAHKITFAP